MQDFLLQLDQFFHLLDEPRLDMGLFMEIIDAGTLAQGLIHDEVTLTRRPREESHQLIERSFMEVLCKTESVAVDLQGTDRLLQGLLVRLADAHHLSDRAHLGPELVDGPRELFKGPAGELDNDIVTRGGVFVQGPLSPVRYLIQGQPGRQH